MRQAKKKRVPAIFLNVAFILILIKKTECLDLERMRNYFTCLLVSQMAIIG